MTCIPAEPDVPADQHATGPLSLRYEDVVQDGRVALTTLPYSLAIVWREMGERPMARELRRAGIIPVLTRLCLEGGPGTVSVFDPLEVRGTLQVAHARGPDGAVERLVLLMWTTITGRRGRMIGPPPEGAGEPVAVGRVFAEHVFTRLFAPPEQRKVTSLAVAGGPAVPPAEYAWRAPTELLALPPDAVALDDAPVPDETATVFGLDHTDSNQHVNSLVYPQLLVDAALRRLAAHGVRGSLLSRELELAFRKPSFAGDGARFAVRAFRGADGRPGAVGSLQPSTEPGGRPLVTGRVRFDG